MTTENPPKRPPNDRGQGRKDLPPELRTITRSCRLTPEGWERFVELGSNKWLAEAVERDHKKRLNAGKS